MVYSLQEKTERGSAQGLIREIDPVFLEIAEQILKEGERIFEKIDWNILFPMADHIAFAVKRIRNGKQIGNPLTGDIAALFHMEQLKLNMNDYMSVKIPASFHLASEIRSRLSKHLRRPLEEAEIGSPAMRIERTAGGIP